MVGIGEGDAEGATDATNLIRSFFVEMMQPESLPITNRTFILSKDRVSVTSWESLWQ
jgi:hypothetical protein